jgi:hypothetical protein
MAVFATAWFATAQETATPLIVPKGSLPAASQSNSAGAAKPQPGKPILPDVFDGWELNGAVKPLTKAADADPVNAAALAEYGFTDGAVAAYTRGDLTLELRAFRFSDATGAYGAYSFYRQNGWPKEEIGAGAASNKNQVIFWQGNLFADARFNKVDPSIAG